MLNNAYLKTLRDYRRTLAWWSLGLVALIYLHTSLYPTVRAQPELDKLVKNYPDILKAFLGGESIDFTTAVGYLNGEVFSMMLPLLLLIFAVGAAARAIAGEEEDGTLELLLAAPLSRNRLVAYKFLALTTMVMILGAVTWLALVSGGALSGLDLSSGKFAAAVLSSALFTVAVATVTFTLGCATGRRTLSIGIGAALGLAAFILNSLAILVEWLEPWRKFSLFYHYFAGDPLRNGLQADHLFVLFSVTVLLVVSAFPVFARRDIGV